MVHSSSTALIIHDFCFQDFLKTQLISSDVSMLDLSGTEQLTDTFFYLIYEKQINFPCLKNVNLSGRFFKHIHYGIISVQK